ncbi:MAG: DUF3267 domain-containing protein [Lawsonibacter sp.]|nr:DUF3267 domain-containing protein [Lawsonibacter sp.]
MEYTKKLPTTDKELSTQLLGDGWEKIWEPRNLAFAMLLSVPFVFLLGSITLWLAYLLQPRLFGFISSESFEISFNIDLKLLLFIVVIFAYMLIHELIHAAFIPNFSKSGKTFWGLNGLFGFVFTTEPIKKGRFIIISIMPFIVLSLVPLYLLNFFSLLNWYTVVLCLINATGSCVDFLNVILIAFQVKCGHTIINNGFETYHRLIK